jgi:protein ImuB
MPVVSRVTMLEDVGIERCGQLAELPREAVEVRFGPEAVALWRLARAEDERRLFRSVGREQPGASLDFIDYVVTDPERLLFTVNALLGTVCEGLADQGAHARRMILSLPLANGETWRRVLRPARPTGSRSVWLRHTRLLLERLSVPDAVAGVGLQVDGMESAAAVQGDLFDAGFATASAVEAALARLLEAQGQVVVRPDPTEHPLAERRSSFEALEAEQVLAPIPSGPADVAAGGADPTGLTLQLLPDPRPVLVEAVQERDHILPIRFRDGAWKQLVTAAGPDRVSGGRWEEPYAREYFRCVTQDGVLVWLFRDGRDDAWYLHGWWD